ncbi:hypothetical protein A1O3_04860 [Capronia epimyces CBS 606.96]|uniref:Fungal N-terminal domain-containing protein n=1 Tax=Capronia epimyces CBS 606.96 TaxID=1182542 RepID=W9XVC9_9EURO|nr:uncharacterized protein A1O3_04860 [Capronia epimyces CBS 606.96]EXJ84193.1 hypothetical protein A1O3_04860 [Capronia epimyces CBS 606.96]
MVVPAFGFSVGDFIAAIELCAKVGKSLRTVGGASDDYQHVAIELEGLQLALARLQALEPTESNVSQVNAIRGMALACRLPLQEFLTKIQTYESQMGPWAASSLKGAGKKAKWAVFITQDVQKLRGMVSAKVWSINLLLATHAS